MLPYSYPKSTEHIVTPQEWANRCQWEHLTPKEQQQVCLGGCGISVLGFKIIPNFIYGDACCHHDFAWLRGGDERVRKIIERAFQQDIQRAVSSYYFPYHYNFWGQTYSTVTRKVGWLRWNYGPMKTKDQILELAYNKKVAKNIP